MCLQELPTLLRAINGLITTLNADFKPTRENACWALGYLKADAALEALEERKETDQDENVLAVSPTGLASGYYLTQHPLTVIEVETLLEKVRDEIAAETQIGLSDFELIKIGRAPRGIPNHSLNEYV